MATEDARKLFVAGLPDSITEDVLREIFEAAGGTVVEVSLPRDRATGRPRGFGFVTLSTSEDAANVRGSLDGSMQAGRSISVRPFSSEPPRRTEPGAPRETSSAAGPAEDRTLYVGNLPYDTSQVEVTQLLEQSGVTTIVRVHLPAGPDGRLRGFGFITLGNAEAGERGDRLAARCRHSRQAADGEHRAPARRAGRTGRRCGPRPTGPRPPPGGGGLAGRPWPRSFPGRTTARAAERWPCRFSPRRRAGGGETEDPEKAGPQKEERRASPDAAAIRRPIAGAVAAGSRGSGTTTIEVIAAERRDTQSEIARFPSYPAARTPPIAAAVRRMLRRGAQPLAGCSRSPLRGARSELPVREGSPGFRTPTA